MFTDLRKAEESQSKLSQDVVKANSRSNATQLRSPIDGVVDQLLVHTLGGVVTPAQPLMIVVPDDRGLIIQAQLSDRDAGFVHARQDAKVKVETFNFTRYGLIEGRVVNVSRDVITPTPQSNADSGLGATRAGGKPGGPAYVARIQLNRDYMRVDGSNVPLQPGMTVTVEGTRRADRSDRRASSRAYRHKKNAAPCAKALGKRPVLQGLCCKVGKERRSPLF